MQVKKGRQSTTEDRVMIHEIGVQIKRIRKQKGLSQHELAYRAEIEPASLCRIESGRINLTVLTLKRIASALQVSIENLFRYEL